MLVHNLLQGTVARLCNEAGISGFRSNHSFRVTTATRLYQADVDEQLIMERTGHLSLECSQVYGAHQYHKDKACKRVMGMRARPLQLRAV